MKNLSCMELLKLAAELDLGGLYNESDTLNRMAEDMMGDEHRKRDQIAADIDRTIDFVYNHPENFSLNGEDPDKIITIYSECKSIILRANDAQEARMHLFNLSQKSNYKAPIENVLRMIQDLD